MENTKDLSPTSEAKRQRRLCLGPGVVIYGCRAGGAPSHGERELVLVAGERAGASSMDRILHLGTGLPQHPIRPPPAAPHPQPTQDPAYPSTPWGASLGTPRRVPAVSTSRNLSLNFHLNLFPCVFSLKPPRRIHPGIAAGHARLLHPPRPWCDADAGLSSRVFPPPPCMSGRRCHGSFPPSPAHVRSGWGLFAKQCRGDFSSRSFAVHGSLGSSRRATARPRFVPLVGPPVLRPRSTNPLWLNSIPVKMLGAQPASPKGERDALPRSSPK